MAARINQDLLNNAYDWQGVERCDALNAKDFGWRMEMDHGALSAMDTFVGGFRMREWKPENDSIVNNPNYNPRMKYCYMYNSSNQIEDLRDRALNANNGMVTCDAFKAYTNHPEFITRTFEDETPDKTHTLTYKKCVIEVDTDKITPSNLNAFWKTMGENECAELYRKNNSTLTNIKEAFTQCNNLNKYYKKAASAYDRCVTECNIIIDNLRRTNTEYIGSNCDFYGMTIQEEQCTVPGTSNDLYLELVSRRNMYAESNALLATKQADLKSLTARVAGMRRREQELQAYLKSIQEDYGRCSNIDIPQALEEIDTLTRREADLKGNITQITKMLADCRANLVVAKKTWHTLSNQNAKLKAENDALERDLYLCKVDVDALKEQIVTHKSDVGKFGSLYQACQAELTTLIAKNEGMVKRVKDLTFERDEWLRRCSGQQQAWHNNNVQMVANYTNMGVKLGNDLCGSAEPIANEIARMVRVRDALIRTMGEMQAASCSASFSRSCCK